MAEAFGGNPFHIIEDVVFGDDRHKTGWTLEKIQVLAEYYGYKKERAEKMPKKRGFYVEHNPFRYEWDEEIEKHG